MAGFDFCSIRSNIGASPLWPRKWQQDSKRIWERGTAACEFLFRPWRQRPHTDNGIQRVQSYYAAELIYIPIICLAKLSLILFVYNITPDRLHRKVMQGLGATILMFSIVSEFSAAFQCGVRHSWEIFSSHCFNQVWYMTSANHYALIVASLRRRSGYGSALMTLRPTWQFFWYQYWSSTTWRPRSHTNWSSLPVSRAVLCRYSRLDRYAVLSNDSSVIVATLCRLVYLGRFPTDDAPDKWIAVVCTQLQICLSISSTCVPYIKPLFEGLEVSLTKLPSFG